MQSASFGPTPASCMSSALATGCSDALSDSSQGNPPRSRICRAAIGMVLARYPNPNCRRCSSLSPAMQDKSGNRRSSIPSMACSVPPWLAKASTIFRIRGRWLFDVHKKLNDSSTMQDGLISLNPDLFGRILEISGWAASRVWSIVKSRSNWKSWRKLFTSPFDWIRSDWLEFSTKYQHSPSTPTQRSSAICLHRKTCPAVTHC